MTLVIKNIDPEDIELIKTALMLAALVTSVPQLKKMLEKMKKK